MFENMNDFRINFRSYNNHDYTVGKIKKNYSNQDHGICIKIHTHTKYPWNRRALRNRLILLWLADFQRCKERKVSKENNFFNKWY